MIINAELNFVDRPKTGVNVMILFKITVSGVMKQSSEVMGR